MYTYIVPANSYNQEFYISSGFQDQFQVNIMDQRQLLKSDRKLQM